MFIWNLLYLLIAICFTQQKLISVIQFIRHGARCPIDYYGDVIRKYLPFTPAQLTNKGFNMARSKGNQVRQRYESQSFVKEIEANPEYIQVFSTEKQRTVFTALGYLKGLFPNLNSHFIGLKDSEIASLLNNEKENFFHTKSFLRETANKLINVEMFNKNQLYLYHNLCLKYDPLKIKKTKDTFFDDSELEVLKSLYSKFPKMFEEYCRTKYNGATFPFECPDDLFKNTKFIRKVISTLDSINFHKVDKIDPEILKLGFISDLIFHYVNYNDYMAKQSGTNLFKYIKSFLKNVDNCPNENQVARPDDEETNISIEKEFKQVEKKFRCKRYALVSSHDDVLQNLIRNMFDYEQDVKSILDSYKNKPFSELESKLRFYWPFYVSDFTVELHQNEEDGKKYVKVVFDGREVTDLPLKKNELGYAPVYTQDGVNLEDFLQFINSRIDNKTKHRKKCKI